MALRPKEMRRYACPCFSFVRLLSSMKGTSRTRNIGSWGHCCGIFLNLTSQSRLSFSVWLEGDPPSVRAFFNEPVSKSPICQDVVRQVYALWDLLAARDVRYSSITTTVADSDAVPSQHIRMLEETANNSQANCVDGSVLLISLLRKIGIHAALVLEPGHCFVAFSADADGKIALGLETTLITAELETPEEIDELLDESVDENMRNETSWSSFVAAVNVGTSTLVKNDEQLKSGRDDDYAFIDIRTWRAKGVLPIPFHGEEKLVSYEFSSNDGEADVDEDEEDAE